MRVLHKPMDGCLFVIDVPTFNIIYDEDDHKYSFYEKNEKQKQFLRRECKGNNKSKDYTMIFV